MRGGIVIPIVLAIVGLLGVFAMNNREPAPAHSVPKMTSLDDRAVVCRHGWQFFDGGAGASVYVLDISPKGHPIPCPK